MKNINIKIIGDIIIDKWIDGKKGNLSAEAPIKIFNTYEHKASMGGAGNLCINLKKLLNNFVLYTEIGKDENGKKLIQLLKKNKIDFRLIRQKKITTSKKRFFIGDKLIFREDIEDDKNNKKVGNLLLRKLKKNDIVIISDYKKGTIFKELHSRIINKNCLTFVDPKNQPSFYKKAFLVKPNMNKFVEWCKSFSKKKAFDLLKKMNWTWLIVTNSSKGVHVFNKYGVYNYYKVKKVNNPNVIGAGDIFFSSLIYFYLKNYNIFTSVELSSYGATECIRKKKIRYINKKDFLKDKVFTNGVFDILHEGHLKLLKFAKKFGKKLIVGINSDKSVRKIKGPNRPHNNILKRINNLRKTNLIDKIYVFNNINPFNLIKKIKPDLIIKGDDYNFNNVAGSKISNVILFKKYKKYSTSNILKKIK